jgi:beta-glucosidase
VYPFGFGLSYASFGYSGLSVTPVRGSADNGLLVKVKLRNTSARAGDEVPQLYIAPQAHEGAPRHALRGVQRVTLQPGETRELSFQLGPRDLSFVTPAGERRLIPGRYRLSVGPGQPGSGVEVLSATFDLRSNAALPQ